MLTCGCPESAPDYEKETGFVEKERCPVCSWHPGDPEPDMVTEGHDAATQAEIDAAWRQHAEEQR